MNQAELRRLLLIVLPAALLLAVAVLVIAFVGDEDEAAAPGVGSSDGPRINDHWHARYTFTACGERQPNAPDWLGGVHTHADGIIHIHPFYDYEEGRGARLVKWFEYGGGELTADSIRMPGIAANDEDNTWENGEQCPDGGEGALRISVNGEPLDDWTEYIPQDQDSIAIVFGPDE